MYFVDRLVAALLVFLCVRDRRAAAAGRDCAPPRAAARRARAPARASSSVDFVLPASSARDARCAGSRCSSPCRSPTVRSSTAPVARATSTNSAVADARRADRAACSSPPPSSVLRRERPDPRPACCIVPMPAIHRSRALPVEIDARLREQRRDDAAARRSSFASAAASRAGTRRSRTRRRAWCVGPSCAGVSLCSVQIDVIERRIARPRLEHAHVEVEPVHLGAHELIVDLLLDRPALESCRAAAPDTPSARRACAPASRPCSRARLRAAAAARRRASPRTAPSGPRTRAAHCVSCANPGVAV